mmetsp:Transcript_33102/g.40045  ORF Transcript_33102/g.40045 Transcript_33102/m.40045 type:complete len:156 (+) Transcript_33102:1238-1705(+)
MTPCCSSWQGKTHSSSPLPIFELRTFPANDTCTQVLIKGSPLPHHTALLHTHHLPPPVGMERGGGGHSLQKRASKDKGAPYPATPSSSPPSAALSILCAACFTRDKLRQVGGSGRDTPTLLSQTLLPRPPPSRIPGLFKKLQKVEVSIALRGMRL